MDIKVIDLDMMSESRSVNSLSGGEIFIVSLALSLALSSLSSNRMKIESLFIDEGFGALDSETLKSAMDALEQLQNGTPLIDPNQIKATDPTAIEEAVKNYAEELKELTEVLSRVKDQTARMSTDSEEMENLNRTLTGIATVYELQLRNISKQVSTIEQIDEQTRKMAGQIEELNKVYARMIQALTVNMGVAPGQAPTVEK